MKIIAFYLPQFHEIPENNEWWGEGFTEWTNVREAKPTFKGQYQPRIPLNNEYYNLTDVGALEWQAKIAKKHGVYGFCYYHYWFEGEMLLHKPAEIMLKNKSVDIPFCFSWANHTWRRNWANKENVILKKQTYGDEKDWRKHFFYLLDFFKDDRYIKIDGKPMMVLYNPQGVKEFPDMMKLWQQLARENGLPGIAFLHQQNEFDHNKEPGGELYDYGIEFQMNQAVLKYINNSFSFSVKRVLNRIADIFPFMQNKLTTMHYSYDDIWNIILKTNPRDNKWIPGAFVDWDNTPRRKNRGQLCTDVTPEKFKKYLSLQIKRTREIYNKDYLFMFAWNEWGESGYLEPDERYGYKMLESVREALIENDEFPQYPDVR
ncbi:glycosyltransferase WbsX family protein [Clostridium sp. DL1XJH146]